MAEYSSEEVAGQGTNVPYGPKTVAIKMTALEERVVKIEANYANRLFLTGCCLVQVITSILLWMSNGNHKPITQDHLPVVPPIAPSASGNTVTIGDAKKQVSPQRDYLTTLELGDREGVAQRTITAWIAEGRIAPAPVQKGRCWLIDTEYKILPPK